MIWYVVVPVAFVTYETAKAVTQRLLNKRRRRCSSE